MAYELRREDLEPLLLGAAFFGSGGGGTIESARHLAAHFVAGDYYPADTVKVVSVDEATEGAAVMVAYLGAPEAINSATYPIGPVTAVQNVQTRLASQSVKLAYVMPPESGALGFTVAALVAAKLGLAVIDADGAGRAVPSLPMLTFAAAEIDPRPAFLVSQGGLCVELDVTPRDSNHGGPTHQRDVSAIVEQMMRPVVADPEFGQFGGLAMWVMKPTDIGRATPIRGTLTRALDLGRALQGGQIGSARQMIGAGHLRARRAGLGGSRYERRLRRRQDSHSGRPAYLHGDVSERVAARVGQRVSSADRAVAGQRRLFRRWRRPVDLQ